MINFDILKVILNDEILYYYCTDNKYNTWSFFGFGTAWTEEKIIEFKENSIVPHKHRKTIIDKLNINYKDIENVNNLY